MGRLKGLVLDDTRLLDLAVTARANAGGLITEARLLLDAGRVARCTPWPSYGSRKPARSACAWTPCSEPTRPNRSSPVGTTTPTSSSQSHILALLYVQAYPDGADVARRLENAVRTDAARKLRGLYGDPTPDGVATPEDISEAQAAEMVGLAEAVLEILEEMDLAGAFERF